jgi:hypothetical protein
LNFSENFGGKALNHFPSLLDLLFVAVLLIRDETNHVFAFDFRWCQMDFGGSVQASEKLLIDFVGLPEKTR